VTNGKKRSGLMLVLAVPMYASALLFFLQFLFAAKLNLDLALVAGTCLVLITAVAATIKNSAISDD
jgi:hypothetical protein